MAKEKTPAPFIQRCRGQISIWRVHDILNNETILTVLVLSILLSIGVFRWYGDVWLLKWPNTLLWLCLLSGFYLARLIHWSFVPYILYTVFHCWYLFGWRDNHYGWMYSRGEMAYVDILVIGKMSAYRLMCIFLTVFPLALASNKTLRVILNAVGWFCLVNSLYVIGQWFWFDGDYREAGGFFGNPSINATLIAYTFPLLIKVAPLWVLPIVPMAILMSESSVGLGGFLISCAVYVFLTYWQVSKKVLAYVAAILIAVVLIAVVQQGEELLYNNGRLPVWQMAYSWWKENCNIWFGWGPGLTSVMFPHIQSLHKFGESGIDFGAYYIWMHNDWLQLLLEQGILGVLTMVPLVYFCLYYSIHAPYLCASLVSLLATCFVNFQFHLPVHSAIAVALVVVSFRSRTTVEFFLWKRGYEIRGLQEKDARK